MPWRAVAAQRDPVIWTFVAVVASVMVLVFEAVLRALSCALLASLRPVVLQEDGPGSGY